MARRRQPNTLRSGRPFDGSPNSNDLDQAPRPQFGIAWLFLVMFSVALALGMLTLVPARNRMVIGPPLLYVSLLLFLSIERPKLLWALFAGAVVGFGFPAFILLNGPQNGPSLGPGDALFLLYLVLVGIAVVGSLGLCFWRPLLGVIGFVGSLCHLSWFIGLLAADFRL